MKKVHTENIIFKPIKCTQFKLDGYRVYLVDQIYNSVIHTKLYMLDNRQAALNIIKQLNKSITEKDNKFVLIWDAITKKFTEVQKNTITNLEYPTATFGQENLDYDIQNYVEYNIKNIVNIIADLNKLRGINCLHRSDLYYLVRLEIKQNNNVFLSYFDEYYPDNRDVVEGIERVLRQNLHIILTSKNTLCAYKYLKKYGYTEMPGFNESWTLLINLYKLPGIFLR